MRFFTLLVTITGIGLLSISCTTAPVATSHWQGPITAGTIEQPVINEASGLAASRRADNIFWVNNDSGGEPVLYAIDGKGRYLGSVRFEGATLYDWEDCASFKIDGKSYLLAADVGDNYAQRKDCVLYIIAEPDPATLDPHHELSAAIVGQIRYTYPEGARDCENVAVDPVEGNIYLISKRTVPPFVYRLPLSLEKSPAILVAARVGELNGIPPTHWTQCIDRINLGQIPRLALQFGHSIRPTHRRRADLWRGLSLYPPKRSDMGRSLCQ